MHYWTGRDRPAPAFRITPRP